MQLIPRSTFLIIYILFFSISTNAQNVQYTPPCCGFPSIINDRKLTNDGGCIFVGTIHGNHLDTIPVYDVEGNLLRYQLNNTNTDFLIEKFNNEGKREWHREYGGKGDDEATNVEQTADGGYIVVGNTNSNDGNVFGNHGLGDAWILKLTKNGEIEWQKAIGGSDYDEAFNIKQTKDGGYIIAGYTASLDGDLIKYPKNTGSNWIVKLKKDGHIEWQKIFEDSSPKNRISDFSINQSTDGGYNVSFNCKKDIAISKVIDSLVILSNGTPLTQRLMSACIMKLSNKGELEWKKTISDGNSDLDVKVKTLKQLKDNEYMIGIEQRPHYVLSLMSVNTNALL